MRGEEGSKAVVFLHAAVADSGMWFDTMSGIRHPATLISYDRREFGATEYEKEDYSSVSDLFSVVSSICGEEQVVLVGCSQGCRIALDAALEYPSRVAGLILIAPSVPGAPEPELTPNIASLLDRQAQLQRHGELNELNRLKAHLWLDGPTSVEGRVGGEPRNRLLEMNRRIMNAPPAGLDRDTSQFSPAYLKLQELDMPTLIAWGDLDFPHICDRSASLVSRISGACGLELAGTAHLPSLERPELIASVIDDFLVKTQQ